MLQEEKNDACRNFNNKLGQLRINQVHGPPVTRGRLKNSKIRSFNGRTHFCSIPLVTPGTVDVNISAAAKAVMKTCKVQNRY